MLTPKECNLLIKYHKANQNKITYDDPADQYNGRRIPLASINNLNIKRIIAKYQYQIAFVADQEINLLAALTEIMVECEFK